MQSELKSQKALIINFYCVKCNMIDFLRKKALYTNVIFSQAVGKKACVPKHQIMICKINKMNVLTIGNNYYLATSFGFPDCLHKRT